MGVMDNYDELLENIVTISELLADTEDYETWIAGTLQQILDLIHAIKTIKGDYLG
jgi:hypothetical protein